MMCCGDTNGRKIKHFLKRLTWHRKKSWKRVDSAIERYILILNKEEKFGPEDKWVKNEKRKAELRLKKLWVTNAQIKEALEARGLKSLSSKFN